MLLAEVAGIFGGLLWLAGFTEDTGGSEKRTLLLDLEVGKGSGLALKFLSNFLLETSGDL